MIIDRFEGAFEIVELDKREFIKLPKKILPPSAEEGSVLKIIVDQEQTSSRAVIIASLEADLFEE